MPFEFLQPPVDWSHRTEPSQLPELMDGLSSVADLRTCLRDLGQVNRLTLGYRPTLDFLQRLYAKRNNVVPLRVLDVGFGGGDVLAEISRWSQTHNVPLTLTGIDINPQAARIASERFPDLNAQWLTGDAMAYDGEVDVIVSSLLTHHLQTPEVIAFLDWMESKAVVGWFINDLKRSQRSAKLFAVLASVMRWHHFVRHDGPVSFARSFTRADWLVMLAQAKLQNGVAQIRDSSPSRLCVERLK